jgi:hypothetical protein
MARSGVSFVVVPVGVGVGRVPGRGTARRAGSVAAIAVALLGAAVGAACSGPAAPTTTAPPGRTEVRRSALGSDVTVTVLDGNGNPRVGDWVTAIDAAGDQVAWQQTDGQGQTVFSLDPDTYQFMLGVGGTNFFSDACTVPGCTATTLQISNPVVVSVTDGYGGTRPDVPLVAFDTDGNQVAWPYTDELGIANVYLQPGAYMIVAQVGGTTFASGPNGHCVIPGCTSATIAATDVMVTVADGNGNPIAGQQIAAIVPDGTGVAWSVTDDQGHADTFVKPGAYLFRAVIDGNYFDSGPDGHCVVPGCRTASIGMPAPVVVTVVDAAGHPIANQDVVALKSAGYGPDATTDAQGHVTFTLAPDTWQFQASCGAEMFVSGDPGSCPVPGCTAARITMICRACAGRPNGSACDDGNACTQTDTCQAGVCTGGNPVVCAAIDQCHDAGACVASTGLCTNPHKADGTACDDGDRCSAGDSCRAGTCLPGPANACTGPGDLKYVPVIDLGSAQGLSYATGINNNGVVVGSDVPAAAGVYQRGYPGSRGFRWSESEGMVYLPWPGAQSFADAINDAGVTSVSAGTDPWALFPCRYDAAVDSQPVCQSSPGFSTSVNAAGTVTGWIADSGFLRMFRLGAGSMEILPSAPSNTDAYGTWIDADGSVVAMQPAAGAVRYTNARGAELLTSLLPADSGWFPVNPAYIRSGEIGGWGYHGGFARAFRIKTTPSGDVSAVSTLPMPSTFQPDAPNLMAADASNAAGEIVGTIWDSAATWPEAAFVYTDNLASIDLNTLIDPQSGWTLLSAWAINDHHEVVGFGLHDGGYRAYKLTLPDLSPCRPTDSCHTAGTRDLLTGVCPNAAKPDGSACDDGNVCTQGDVCTAGTCGGLTAFACAAPDNCHTAGTCNSGPTPIGALSDQNLIGWWKLDGNGKDETPGGHDLDNEGAMEAPGRFGTAMYFDGTSCMTVPIWDDARMQGVSGLTLMAWIKPDKYTCDSQFDVNTALGRGWDYSIGSWCYEGVPDYYAQGLAGTIRPTNPVGWGYGGGWGMTTAWQQVALTWDHQTMYTYLNGQLINSWPIPGEIDDVDPFFTVGCMTSWYWSGNDRINNFHGAVDEVRLYRRVLTPTEIATYYAGADPCTHPVLADGTSCNDSNACTQTDSCQAGTCVGTNAITCPAADQCHAGVCDPATGACSSAPVADGTACNDGNLCTHGDSCQAGLCSGGTTVTCAAPDQCHGAGVCNPATGACFNPPLADETPCNDSDPCTQGDICLQGVCNPGLPRTCPAFDTCHLAGTCDSTSGACSNPPNPDPSCSGAPAPTVTPQAQGTPGTRPHEVIGLDSASGTVTISSGSTGTGATTVISVPAMAGSMLECLADMDNDGAIDIVFASPSTGSLQYLRRLDPQMAMYDPTPVVIDAATPAGVPGPGACGDIDGDGNIDIVTSFAQFDPDNGTKPTMAVYRAIGGGSQSFQRIIVPHGFPTGVVVGGLSLADFDGDGRLDLVAYAANNQPLLDSQVFVFPNGGIADPVTSGVLDFPFSQTTRVSVPGTGMLWSQSAQNWGAVATRDFDGDGHPDIWALGNTGGLFLYRSLGGFQFAQAEFDGVILNLDPTFTIAAVNADGDGIPDLLVAGLAPGAIPRVFIGAGAGMLANITAPLAGTPTTGSLPADPKPLMLQMPAEEPDIGLVKESPVATTYTDEEGITRPSILMQAVNGHLVEHVQRAQYTYTDHPIPQPPPVPMNSPAYGQDPFCSVNADCGSTGLKLKSYRTSTVSLSWVWIDHGMPAVNPKDLIFPHTVPSQTIVASQPAVSLEDFGGAGLVRRIFVRGIDGHLWELIQDNGKQERWVDDGLPSPRSTPTGLTDTTGGATVPMVGSPSVVQGSSGASPVSIVYVLDAAGRLDSFRHSLAEDPWQTAGPIGSKNCFGNPGQLGDGSPTAITYSGFHGEHHIEVFVVGAQGDLFSWRDNNWEEILDSQYLISGTMFDRKNPPSSAKVCPNGVNSPTDIYHPNYAHSFEMQGTPAALGYFVRACKRDGSCSTDIRRVVYVRERGSGKLAEFRIFGDETSIADTNSTAPTVTPVVNVNNLFGPPYALIADQPTQTFEPQAPFFVHAGVTAPDTKIDSDPVAVQDATGEITILVTEANHKLAMLHQPADQIEGEWDLQPFPSADGDQSYSQQVIGTAHAIVNPGGAPFDITGVTPEPAHLDIFATRSNGILAQATARADAGHWATLDARACSQDTRDCASHDVFQWLLDSDHDHTPPVVPAILDEQIAKSLNQESNPHTGRASCDDQLLLDSILPQWVSPQRWKDDGVDTRLEYDPLDPHHFQTGGYDDDAMVEVEGVVVSTHVSPIDTPIDHTHGAAFDIPRVHHDWTIHIAPDVQYQKLLTNANMLEGGVMELEWEMADVLRCVHVLPATPAGIAQCDGGWYRVTGEDDLAVGSTDSRRAGMTADAVPTIGDRVAVRGRFILDCGHPPYRAEIHPIDALAVIHRSDYYKFRYSQFGGRTWYEPADINLTVDGCSLATGLGNVAKQAVPTSDVVADWVPGSDSINNMEKLGQIGDDAQNLAKFWAGCRQFYDSELLSPDNACYTTYEHALNDKFPGVTTGSMSGLPSSLTLPLNMGDFSFSFPGGGPQITPSFTGTAGAMGPVYTSPSVSAQARNLQVCFQLQDPRNHDNVDASFLSEEFEDCQDNGPEELVLWMTVNGQAKLYSKDEDNCLTATVLPGDTLSVGTHGFECDFSCGERWGTNDANEIADETDDRIGVTSAAFTERQNWGLSGGPSSNGSYVLVSQPDVSTHRSRSLTPGDYKIAVTIQEASN